MKKIFVFSFFVFFFTISTQKVQAVLIAHDIVFPLEGVLPVIDSSVISIENYDSIQYYKPCFHGVCDIMQGAKSYSFYKVNENVLTEEQWKRKYYLEHKGCEGYVTQEKEFNKAWFDWVRGEEHKKLSEQFEQEANSLKIPGVGPYVSEKIQPYLIAYLNSKGLTFYGNPICKINDAYKPQYLEKLVQDALYSKTITIPVSKGGYGCGAFPCLGGKIGEERVVLLGLPLGQIFYLYPLKYVLLQVSVLIIVGIGIFAILIYRRKKNKLLRN